MDLVANDVIVTLAPEDTDFMTFNKVVTPTIAFGNGVLTIPAGGIPMPDLAYFGLNKAIKGIIPIPNGDGRQYVYVQATHKLKVFGPGSGGIQTYVPGGGDIKGSDNTQTAAPDQDNPPTNGDLIDTAHAVQAGPAWAYSEDLEPDVPRNVCILLKGAAGDSVIPAGSYTFTVTGTFRGAAQTDTITFTYAGAAGTIVAGKYRWAYGVKPFDKITDVVITPAHLANLPVGLLIGVGIGSCLGLPSETLGNIEADILKITKTAADLAVAGTFDVTNKTVNLGTLVDGNDVAIQYKAAGAGGEMSGVAVPATSLGLVVIGQ